MTEFFQSMFGVCWVLSLGRGNVKHERIPNVWKVKLCKSPKILRQKKNNLTQRSIRENFDILQKVENKYEKFESL